MRRDLKKDKICKLQKDKVKGESSAQQWKYTELSQKYMRLEMEQKYKFLEIEKIS